MGKARFLLAIVAYVVVLGTFSAWAQEEQKPLPSMRFTGTFTASLEAAKSETCMRLWPDETYMYLGKPRSREWMEAMYQRFAYQIVQVDGKYLDVGKALVGASEVPAVAEIGPTGETPAGCEVMQVIDNRQVLIRRPEFTFRSRVIGGGGGALGAMHRMIQEGAASVHRDELLFHVSGVDTKNLLDGAKFNAKLVSIGTYSYESVAGGPVTVPSYTVHRPLTREQFAQALASGVRLVSYVRIEQKKLGSATEIKAVGFLVP